MGLGVGIRINRTRCLSNGLLNHWTRQSSTIGLRGLTLKYSSSARQYSSKSETIDKNDSHEEHHEEHHDEHHDEHPLAPPEDFVNSFIMKFFGLTAAMAGVYYLNYTIESKGQQGLSKYAKTFWDLEDQTENYKNYQLDVIADRDYERFWEDQYKRTDYTNYRHSVAVPGRNFAFGNPYQEGLLDHSKLEPRKKAPEMFWDEVK